METHLVTKTLYYTTLTNKRLDMVQALQHKIQRISVNQPCFVYRMHTIQQTAS